MTNARHLPWDQDPEARALVAERGAMSVEEIAVYLGITPRRVHQLMVSALRRIRESGALEAFRDHEAPPTAWELTALHSHGEVGHRSYQDEQSRKVKAA